MAVTAVARRRDMHERRDVVIRLVALTVAVFGLTSCAPVGSTSSVIRVEGMVFYFERLALPPSAVVDVEVRDTARADAPARTLATQRIPATQGPPFKFALSVRATDIDPHAALSVFAAIRDSERLMFITDTHHSVPREGATGLEIRLTFVASPAGAAAPGIVTPVPTAYRCGDETFRIAFEEGRAYVTLPDGSLVTLECLRTGGDPESPRTFTNG
jgi:putative lipoprotein